MLLFQTRENQYLEIYHIASKMAKSGLDAASISAVVSVAQEYEGALDLMKLWADETDQDERNAIISDLLTLRSGVDIHAWKSNNGNIHLVFKCSIQKDIEIKIQPDNQIFVQGVVPQENPPTIFTLLNDILEGRT